MDKKHHLDAPDNAELKDIEQVPDHSELAALYFDPHAEWEGKELISDEERHRRQDKHVEQITTSIRGEFALIGLLVPTPLILLALMLGAWFTYITIESLRFLLIVVIIVIGLWILATFLSVQRVYAIFYQHALRATPFVIVLLSLLGIVTQGLYLWTHAFLPEGLLPTIFVMSLGVYAASIILSFVVLQLWVAPRLSVTTKLICLGILAGILLAGVFVAMFA